MPMVVVWMPTAHTPSRAHARDPSTGPTGPAAPSPHVVEAVEPDLVIKYCHCREEIPNQCLKKDVALVSFIFLIVTNYTENTSLDEIAKQ